MDQLSENIISFLQSHPDSSSKKIHEEAGTNVSYATLKRNLVQLLKKDFIASSGQGKGTRYFISEGYALLHEVDLQKYFETETDKRKINERFNFDLIPEILENHPLFNADELEKLNSLQVEFVRKTDDYASGGHQREMERLAIDLSWKSSQIEGNTYSLLETERLLKEKLTAAGKTKDEAVMLLNHKSALDFIFQHPDYLYPITVKKIEDIHYFLIKELGVDRNLRRRRIGISGTNYKPLDNEFQIKEALQAMCRLVKKKENPFEKALLVLLLISYIQPFADGNKRTARIVCNAILLHQGCCPISFRTVDSLEYKMAMLLFYEKNNLSAVKKIFIDQYEFAVGNYF